MLRIAILPRRLVGLCAGCLLIVGWRLPVESSTSAQAPLGSGKDAAEDLAKRFILPADPVREATRARKLAEKRMPALEELRENADWKRPWEFPEAIKFNPPSLLFTRREFSRNGSLIQHHPEEGYWKEQGEMAAFVGLSADDARKRVADGLDLVQKAGSEIEGIDRRGFLLMMSMAPRVSHPTAPTLAASLDWQSKLAVHLFKVVPTAPQEKRNERDGNRRIIQMLDSLTPGVTDEQLKDQLVQAFTLNQRCVNMFFFRTNNWDELTRLSVAFKNAEQLSKAYEKSLQAATTDQEKGRITKEFLLDPGQKDITIARNLESNMEKGQVRWSAVIVTVREVSVDALEQLKKHDVDADKATLLQVQLNDMFQKAALFAESESSKRDENVQVPIFKVRTAHKGQNSYVISTQVQERNKPPLSIHMASIRNGIVFADIEVISTLPPEEANKDLKFFLDVMHAKTLYGRIEDEAPKTPVSGK